MLTFEEWVGENSQELDFAEAGADWERDFDRQECEVQLYEGYFKRGCGRTKVTLSGGGSGA